LPRLELVSVDEHVVELVMAAAAASACSCTITSPSEPWSVLAAPQGHSARIVDLAAMSSFTPISSALRVDPDGFVLVLPADSRCNVRFHVYSRAAIAALLDDLLPQLPGFPVAGGSSTIETEEAPDLLLGDAPSIRAVRDQIARVASYADVSVLVGHYGRSMAGWKDASDPAAPKDDPGRGVASWAAHRDHVLKGAGMDNAHKLVGDRLLGLSKALPKAAYARLYADASILLANLARSY